MSDEYLHAVGHHEFAEVAVRIVAILIKMKAAILLVILHAQADKGDLTAFDIELVWQSHLIKCCFDIGVHSLIGSQVKVHGTIFVYYIARNNILQSFSFWQLPYFICLANRQRNCFEYLKALTKFAHGRLEFV